MSYSILILIWQELRNTTIWYLFSLFTCLNHTEDSGLLSRKDLRPNTRVSKSNNIFSEIFPTFLKRTDCILQVTLRLLLVRFCSVTPHCPLLLRIIPSPNDGASPNSHVVSATEVFSTATGTEMEIAMFSDGRFTS